MNTTADLIRFFWRFMRLQRGRFFLIFLFSLTWAVDLTVWPYLVGAVVDLFTKFDADRASSWPALKWLLGAGLFLLVFVELGSRFRDYLKARAYPQFEADIRMAMFDHIQHHSPNYFNEHFAGSLANKMTDMTTQMTSIVQNLITLFPVFATCLVSIAFFYQVSVQYALILTVWTFIHFAICIAMTPRCIRYSNEHGEARSVLAGKIVDSLTNNFAVNLFFRFSFERNRISPYQQVEREKSFRAKKYLVAMVLILAVPFVIGNVVLNGWLIHDWMRDRITTGQIIQVFNTTWNVMFVLWYCTEVIPQFFQSIGIAGQALTVMHDPQDVFDPSGARDLKVTQGEIRFESVSFQYGEKTLFENKNVLIRAGERVGLVGYSGGGKSTFVGLILRVHPLRQGKILIDGQEISHVKLESLRNQVALIPQDPLLFHRTLEENIRYGRIDASREEVIEAAKLAHCDEFIRKCPQGYDSLVGERGTKLSGGERQRIAIARALLAAPPILILDEATSALDSLTESYIQQSLEKLMQNRTTIVIAHRLSTLAKMDRVLVFDQGKIVEEGSHRELLLYGGHYARMWQMQAGGFLPESPPLVI